MNWKESMIINYLQGHEDKFHYWIFWRHDFVRLLLDIQPHPSWTNSVYIAVYCCSPYIYRLLCLIVSWIVDLLCPSWQVNKHLPQVWYQLPDKLFLHKSHLYPLLCKLLKQNITGKITLKLLSVFFIFLMWILHSYCKLQCLPPERFFRDVYSSNVNVCLSKSINIFM